ncbi:MAG: FAD-dependent oxidoreductase [Pseudomonadota bacterium]
MGDHTPASGPDFGRGIAISAIPDDGVLAGQVDGQPVLLARVGGALHAVSASCTHYGAPLGEGLRVGDEIRCPWHHACFDLRSGRALHAPAFAPLACWQVEVRAGMAYVRAAAAETAAETVTEAAAEQGAAPRRVVIVGGGAAGYACARRLRERGFGGSIALLSEDRAPPVDRPNLSKDYLAGNAPAEWIPLQAPAEYAAQDIALHLGCTVTALDPATRQVRCADGAVFDYDALLLATGAAPVRLPGFDAPNAFTLRSLADADALLAALDGARTLALVGAGFIGLEAAGALRSRGLEVHVIAPEALPLAGLLGEALAANLLARQRAQGIVFHLGCKTEGFDGRTLRLSDGSTLAVDAVLLGVGVKPRTALAQAAGLAVEDGIRVDAGLRTSAPGVYAAGDVARYPHADGWARVEHWVHAQRQGQAVADAMLGDPVAYAVPPFFWTHQAGIELRYVGHGRGWDNLALDGDPAAGDCLVRYYRGGQLVAAAAIGRDRALLELEAALAGAR